MRKKASPEKFSPNSIKPMNIVIKLTEVDGLPSIKISDNPAKAIGDKETIKFAKWQVKQQIKSYKKSLKKK